MSIIQDFVPAGTGVRTGRKLTDCRGLVVHWIGVCCGRAGVIRKNFERSETGTQYILDWYTGEIIQTMPEDEVAYHVGGTRYTDLKRAICLSDNPNRYLVGIECCIGDKSIPPDWSAAGKYMELGRPSDAQYEALVAFAAEFLTRHGMGTDQLYLHYDITGKLCHAWFCKDFNRWAKFKRDVKNKMEGEVEMTKEEVLALVRGELADRDALVAEQAQKVSPWAQETWDKLCKEGIFDGTRPGGAVTREQLAAVIARLEARK